MNLSREVRSAIRVRYAETDGMRVAYHANYLVWFEVARGDYLREVGLDYNRMEAEGAFIVVAEAHCKYLAPARFDDELVVYSRISDLRSRSLRFEYRVMKGNKLLTEGWTAHVLVNAEGRSCQIPSAVRAALEGSDFRGDAIISPLA